MRGMNDTRPAWLPERLFPFQSRFLEIEGCRVHYIDEGAGPPLLLLHGNPTYSFLYREVVRGLSDRFRCACERLHPQWRAAPQDRA